MTSRSFRAIMAQAGLADDDLERERLKSQRDAANTRGLVDAAGAVGNGLLGGAFKALDVYRGDVAGDAEAKADQAIANHIADAGDDVDTPAKVAAKEADRIESPSSGYFGGVLDALGGRAAAEAKAKARATQGISSEMKANSDKAKAAQKAADDEAAKLAREEQKQRDAEEAEANKAEHDSGEKEAARQNALELERMKEAARLAEIDAKAKAKKGAGGGAPGASLKATDKKEAAKIDAFARAADAADELAKIYEGGKLKDGVTGAVADRLPGNMQDDDRIKAHSLVSELALLVPGALSGANRLNKTEYEHALNDVVGAVGGSDSNAHRAQRARALEQKLRAAAADEQRSYGLPDAVLHAKLPGVDTAALPPLEKMTAEQLSQLSEDELRSCLGGT